jgi:P-type Cu+ transporter
LSTETENILEKPSKTACYHCGDVCNSPVSFDNKDFCCDGCKTVYSILKEGNMCEYYTLQNTPGNSLKRKVLSSKFSFLESEDIVDQLVDFKSDNLVKVTFYVPGIHCSSCIWLLENLHKLNEGVLSSRIDFLKKQVTVNYHPKETTLKAVVQLMAEIGYEPLLSLNDVVKKQDNKESRKMLKKLAVAGFCSGNIMMLSFGEYFGLDFYSKAFFGNLFGYLNVILAIPVMFYSASDYFTSAYQGLRKKIINLDVPIALGMGVILIRSVYEVLFQIGPGYFDSLTGLVFFLLIGKWFQSKTYEAMSFDRDYTSYFPLAITIKDENGQRAIPVNQLKKGDRIIVRNQELIPADSILLGGEGYIDYSFVTGESNLVPKIIGEMVYAGGRQVGGTIEMEIMKDVSQSYLTQLWNNAIFKKKEKSRLQTFSDMVGKYFTLATIVVSLSTFIAWYFFIDAERAFFIFVSVLLVACPCALALSTPFALGNMLRIMGANKFYLKNTDVIEEMAQCDTIVFDKTGTITKNDETNINYTGEELTEEEKSLIAAATYNSSHPLSRIIYANFQEYKNPHSISYFAEHPGKGIEADSDGKRIKLGNANFARQSAKNSNEFTQTKVFVCIDDDVKGYFSFANKYRDNMPEMVNELGQYFTLYVLSGDHDGEKHNLSKLFNNKAGLYFEQSPVEKLDHIKHLQDKGSKTIMIGDGLNDAGALKQSNVGIAITDDITNFSPSCDAILDASAFNKLSNFIEVSKNTMRVIKASFAFSLIYNFITLSFAVSGFLTPLVAAIIMPTSSITVVLFATIGTNYFAKKGGLR